MPLLQLNPVDRALRKTELITATGIMIGSLEALVRPETYDDRGMISWEVGRTRFKKLSSERADRLGAVLSPPGLQGLVALRLAAATVVMGGSGNRRTRAVAMWTLVVTNAALHARNNFGADGTDHMNTVVCAALAASSLFPEDDRARRVCAQFIAAQSCLSYAASGLAKAISPAWRDGSALTGIFRTHTYGDKRVHTLFKKHPALAKIGGWTVIGWESAFPVVLVVPRRVASALLATGTAFHLGNAAFMGLNRFVWSFSGTYPCVAFCSRNLGSSS